VPQLLACLPSLTKVGNKFRIRLGVRSKTRDGQRWWWWWRWCHTGYCPVCQCPSRPSFLFFLSILSGFKPLWCKWCVVECDACYSAALDVKGLFHSSDDFCVSRCVIEFDGIASFCCPHAIRSDKAVQYLMSKRFQKQFRSGQRRCSHTVAVIAVCLHMADA
jgi:hypothetical protein